MNLSINIPSLPLHQRRTNIRFHTEVRENLIPITNSRSELKITNFATQRSNKKDLEKTNVSKKTLTSSKSISRKNAAFISNVCNPSFTTRVDIAKEEISEEIDKRQQSNALSIPKILQEIFEICESINENFYNYANVESKIKCLNHRIKELKSISCQFYCFCISGLILFEYSNLSLAIFYFDKALKALSSKIVYSFDYLTELMIYKYSSKVFLQSKKLKQAREMAYMYLRKSWRYLNLDEQMNAYDLLGQIQLEEGNIEMSRYFHWRMCHGVREQKQIVLMSNLQLDKRNKFRIQFAVYEDIMIFLKSQEQIVGIISNRFRAEAETQCQGFTKKNRQFLFFTHRSSNRVLRNHRVLERRLIDEKQSNELHFIRPKQIKRLRALITQFNKFINSLKKDWEMAMLRKSIMERIHDDDKF